MRVLVTGHRGYLGTPICEALLAAGHDVVGLDTGLFHRCTFKGAMTDVDPLATVPLIEKDVRDIDIVDLDGIEAVIHLAGLSNDPLGDLDPALTADINHAASLRLARAARDAGVARMVLASSCSVYGASDGDILEETSALAPVTAYARSKLEMERGIAALANDRFAPVFLRSGTVYGLAPRIRFDLVVNNLVAWASATGRVHLKSDGAAWRPVVHVRDVAHAFARILELDPGDIRAKAFNVVDSAQNFRVRELADRVAACMPGCAVVFGDEASSDTRNYRVSGERLHGLIGDWWHTALDDGIKEIAAALARVPVPVEAFEGEAYQRLAHLKMLMRDGILDRDLRAVSFAADAGGW